MNWEEISNIFRNISWSAFSLPRIRFNDIIDMLVIGFLIYKVLFWVKETRAWSLIKGIGIIAIIYIFAYVLQMRVASWLIINSLNVGLIAVLVLFQPELRKLLEEIGESNINKIIPVAGHDNTALRNAAVIEIIKAAKILSESRTGGLIVIENEVPLGDLENTGIPLDALCASQLIINIFEDKTPLHDGALIVRNNRIAAATCILPLTEKEIGRELGTRHRAAVGASEVSDADILVISEETGAISIAKDGKLYKGLTEDALIKMLLIENRAQKKTQLLKERRNK